MNQSPTCLNVNVVRSLYPVGNLLKLKYFYVNLWDCSGAKRVMNTCTLHMGFVIILVMVIMGVSDPSGRCRDVSG